MIISHHKYNRDYILEMLTRYNKGLKGLSTNNEKHQYYFEQFFLKYLRHLFSIIKLESGIDFVIEEQKISVLDHNTPLVAARAATEAYLAYSYIYTLSLSNEETIFRFNCWYYAGLVSRQNYMKHGLEPIPEVTEKLDTEKSSIAELKNFIENSPIFQKLEKNDQNRLIKKLDWRLTPHHVILDKLGLNKGIFFAQYLYQSGYVHTDFISLMQNSQMNGQEALALIQETIDMLLMLGIKFLLQIMSQFKTVRIYYTAEELRELGLVHKSLCEHFL